MDQKNLVCLIVYHPIFKREAIRKMICHAGEYLRLRRYFRKKDPIFQFSETDNLLIQMRFIGHTPTQGKHFRHVRISQVIHDLAAVSYPSGFLHCPEYGSAFISIFGKQRMVDIPICIVSQIPLDHPLQARSFLFTLFNSLIFAEKLLLHFSPDLNPGIPVPACLPCIMERRIQTGYCIRTYINLSHPVFPRLYPCHQTERAV